MSRFEWVSGQLRGCSRRRATSSSAPSRSRACASAPGSTSSPRPRRCCMVLRRGGADLVSTGNLNSTQQETVDYLRANGARRDRRPDGRPGRARPLPARRPRDQAGHHPRQRRRPVQPLPRGRRTPACAAAPRRPRPAATACSRCATASAMPILVINDSPIKQFGENTHAVGAGTVESFIRITNRITNGRRVAVFGYGSVGRGVAAYFRGYNSIVSVIEPQPVLRLRALLDGFDVPDRDAALRRGRHRRHGHRRAEGDHRRRSRPPAGRRRARQRRPPAVGARRAGAPGRLVRRVRGRGHRRDHDPQPPRRSRGSTC